MQGQAPIQEIQAQHGDQQGAHAQVGSREPIQVSSNNPLHVSFFFLWENERSL